MVREYGIYQQGAMFTREDFDPYKTIKYLFDTEGIKMPAKLAEEIKNDNVSDESFDYLCKKLDAEPIERTLESIVSDVLNEYFSELITEIEYALRKEKLATTVMMSHYDKQCEIECIRNLYNMGVKGIVLCPVNDGTEFENYLKLFDIPIVAVGNRDKSLPYVGIDNFKAMKEMTEKVLNDNPQNIIYFSPALNYSDAYAQRLRYEGFLSAVGNKKYSVVTDIDDIKEVYDEKTTIICSNDYYALKVYFKSSGVKVVGFDNIKALGKYKISIDSVGYSMAEIANSAVDIIIGNKKESVIVKHYIAEYTQ